ncbi:exodeoxyribonuclease III [Zavarzinia compransoris]|uniref:Exodeoxyribonuclease III n=1 Tax=Zavarzinia compransoris TaxID=1264899 RepID=A0A317E134_9PROT|nr:exodeoxyribonuclease III [Zavarzinia compransoris]PWR18865.1 exodeoxyribonuclease III [Zavarzinia compransoris]TDP48860.1 exodeoxyribonuclease-3 [Zavarzinia compransoris]
MAITIATWNINSVRLRIGIVEQFLAGHAPDILCLQEIKTIEDAFPRNALIEAGYPHLAIAGQKGYHGVAIASKIPFKTVEKDDWCAMGDARHLRVRLENDVLLDNFYIPAGGDEPDPAVNPKFDHKLKFLREMVQWGEARRAQTKRAVVVGDFNVAPLEHDVWSHKKLLDVVSHTPIETDLLAEVQAAHDWVDAVRHFVPATEKLYSWWSYRAADWAAADKGRRLDHIWVTPDLKDGLVSTEILRAARGWDKPSDHVPVLLTLEV